MRLKTRLGSAFIFICAFLLASLAALADSTKPQLTREEKEEFLRTAEIIRIRHISTGITNSQRATLTDGRITHDAHVQTVDIFKPTYTTARGTQLNFRDSYKYNIAAYRLDKLLNLNMVPVSVERKVRGDTAAVTWWVDDVLMMEKERYTKDIQPPDRARWNDQIYMVRAFNRLIYNTDPNLGNFLITKDWDIWMVDFTRAFRLFKKLEKTDGLVRISRTFYEGLRNLTEEEVMSELRPYLRKSEAKALLARRDHLLEYFDKRIARLGEEAVIFDKPGE